MFISSEQHLLNCVQFGTGDRAFLAHGGWVGSWELWQEPLQLMQADWRSVAYDHRGAGATTATADEVTPEGLVADLFAVMAHYELDGCVLAGESMGALTCLQAVLAHPDRFAGLVLVAGAPAMVGEAPNVPAIRAHYPGYVRQFVQDCVPEPDSEHIRRWGEQILLRADPEAAARMFESHYERGIAPALAEVAVPTLVIHGELDQIIPVGVGEWVASTIPGAELVVIPGAGHIPTMTRPAAVVDAINSWAAQALP